MSVTIRHIDESEVQAFRTAIGLAFGEDDWAEEVALERFRRTFPLDGLIGAFDGDTLVGTFGSFWFDLTVPGGSVPMAGTTIVTVRPTHRRRGILSRMMAQHLTEARERGNAVAGLWASDPGIYGRFGYGCAADGDVVSFDGRLVTLPAGPDDVTVHLVDADTAAATFPPVYDAVLPTRPGMFARSEDWWTYRRFIDLERWRHGATAYRHALAERDGAPVAYATYRQKSDWSHGGVSTGTVVVIEALAADDDARRALWSYLTHIDLFPKVRLEFAMVDDPMRWEASNPRLITRETGDSLWVRILDIGAALTGRRYHADGRVVLDVHDPFFDDNSGRWLIDVVEGFAAVTPTTEPADVTLGVTGLGAIYLGGRSLASLAAPGFAPGDTAALTHTDRIFRTNVAPFCPEVF